MALTETVIAKLQGLAERQEELSRLLSDPEVAGDRNQFIDFSREYSELEPLTAHYQQYQKLISNLEEVSALTSDTDRDFGYYKMFLVVIFDTLRLFSCILKLVVNYIFFLKN